MFYHPIEDAFIEQRISYIVDRKRKRKKEKGMKKEKERVKIRVIVGPFKNVISSSIEIGDNARVFLIVKKLEK
jgi:hypothetical protein